MVSPAVERGASASPRQLRDLRRRLRHAGARPVGRRRARWQRRARELRGPGGLRVLAAAAGGAALYGSFAPSTLWWLAVVGLALFGLAVHGRRWRPALGLGLVFGLSFYLPLLSWTTVYVGAVATALALAEALLLAPVGALVAAASRRLPVWPVWAAMAWVAGEALRGRWPFGGFPWGGIAFSQPDGPLLPAASLLGAPGLALLTALAGFALASLLRTVRSWRATRQAVPAVVALALLVLPFAGGLAGRTTVQTGAGAPTTRVAVIQGNVPEPGMEFNARRRAVTDMHAAQTHALAEAVRAGREPRPDLVIWPENSSDIDPYTNADAAAVISSAVRDIGVPVLVGAVVGSGTGPGTYNMGIVWDPVTGPGETYTKRHPVPFAEYMPARSFFRIFSSWVDRAGYFLPGSTAGNLDVAGVPVGDVICFEVVYDDLVRDVVRGGAQVLVVQTNNATFGYTDETYQQQAMSRVRAVEHGREVLIAATSGVSAAIRPDGSVESSIPLFTAGFLDPLVPRISATTPGTVLAAPVEWVATGLVLLALAVVTTTPKLRRRQPAGAPFRSHAADDADPDDDEQDPA
ncbi:apolipoprotein N-acyltransferase [Nakamurella endophytica]|uniref:Apolipoprotein N-acyltransferase n=1 Tax=Nakamurella endophytica TaxID=1748367 RepID=A0A917SQA7_9ACTN|nr:apolipoprotein N-acyltransferase [Nakamurella endophytica]GGL91504.1 apolipoprotein N-acyltransferase [Nakamurella endophytica]